MAITLHPPYLHVNEQIIAAIAAPLLLTRIQGVTASLARILLTISLPFALAAAAVLSSTGDIVVQKGDAD